MLYKLYATTCTHTHSPHDSLSAAADVGQVRVAFQHGEHGVPDLYRVEVAARGHAVSRLRRRGCYSSAADLFDGFGADQRAGGSSSLAGFLPRGAGFSLSLARRLSSSQRAAESTERVSARVAVCCERERDEV